MRRWCGGQDHLAMMFLCCCHQLTDPNGCTLSSPGTTASSRPLSSPAHRGRYQDQLGGMPPFKEVLPRVRQGSLHKLRPPRRRVRCWHIRGLAKPCARSAGACQRDRWCKAVRSAPMAKPWCRARAQLQGAAHTQSTAADCASPLHPPGRSTAIAAMPCSPSNRSVLIDAQSATENLAPCRSRASVEPVCVCASAR